MEMEGKDMTNSELNQIFYNRMEEEQAGFRSWLLGQPPEEILKHAYEYVVREDILITLEENDLPSGQVKALLKSSTKLSDMFHEFQDRETDYMDQIWESVTSKAHEVEKQEQKKVQRER